MERRLRRAGHHTGNDRPRNARAAPSRSSPTRSRPCRFTSIARRGSNKARVDTGDLEPRSFGAEYDMTSVGLRRRMMRDVLYRGRRISRVEMKGNNAPAAVYPLVWDRVQVEVRNVKRQAYRCAGRWWARVLRV